MCFPHNKIAYKQVTLPALLTLHTGIWTFEENNGGCSATSQHTVTIEPGKITDILGDGKTVSDARAYVQSALSGNSSATLGHAKDYAESRR